MHMRVLRADETPDELVLVESNVGTIVGTVQDVNVFGNNKKITRFLGIPYALPPTGELSFRKPVPRQPFTTPWRAIKQGNACLQVTLMPNKPGLTYDEDCLFLNIYKPAGGRADGLAVMVFIHGGGFAGGSADAYIPDTLAVYGDVIVVTINYRVSVWGFLSTEDEHSPGNYGLWDQQLALKWISENIQAFGGDPSRVTIFGESAGASAVVYQSLYEGNTGLFQRAIAESGSITPIWAYQRDSKKDAEDLGKILGCSNMASGPLVDCIRSQPPEAVSAVINDPMSGLFKSPFPFLPSVDGEIVKELPVDVINATTDKSAKGRQFFSQLDFLTGINAEEGTLVIGGFLGLDAENLLPSKAEFEDDFIPRALHLAFGPDIPKVVKGMTVSDYTDWEDPDNAETMRSKIVDIATDFMYSIPMVETIDLHDALKGDSKTSYMYMFDVLPSTRLFDMTPSWSKKATHMDELIYLFFEEEGGFASLLGGKRYDATELDRSVARNIMTLWTNFAKTG